MSRRCHWISQYLDGRCVQRYSSLHCRRSLICCFSGTVYLLTSSLLDHLQHSVRNWKHTYSGNHTQTLFCNCFAIVVLEVIVTQATLKSSKCNVIMWFRIRCHLNITLIRDGDLTVIIGPVRHSRRTGINVIFRWHRMWNHIILTNLPPTTYPFSGFVRILPVLHLVRTLFLVDSPVPESGVSHLRKIWVTGD